MAANSDPDYTEVVICGHCGNKAPLKILAVHKEEEEQQRDKYQVTIWTNTYQMCKCLSCEAIVLRSLFWWQDIDDDIPYELTYLYPKPPDTILYLPTPVQRAYEEALAVKTKSANAYAVMLGRLLQAVCDERNAKGDDLYRRLKDLADRGEIPAKLGQLAQRMRELRNIGAHAEQGKLTAEHMPILDSMASAVLEYIYVVPSYLETAEEQLNELRNKHKPVKL